MNDAFVPWTICSSKAAKDPCSNLGLVRAWTPDSADFNNSADYPVKYIKHIFHGGTRLKGRTRKIAVHISLSLALFRSVRSTGRKLCNTLHTFVFINRWDIGFGWWSLLRGTDFVFLCIFCNMLSQYDSFNFVGSVICRKMFENKYLHSYN